MSSNLNVLQVIPKLGYGGAETGCYDIAHFLPENNCKSYIVTSGGGLTKFIDKKKVKNAWCMPGGKIAVYTGLLDITKNEDGLAAVMGHEIAHAVAKHSVERASRGVLLNTGTAILDIATKGKYHKSIEQLE